MPILDLEETITVRQAAEELGVHVTTIYKWVERGVLKAKRTKTGRLRLRPDDVIAVVQPPENEDSTGR